MRKFVLLLLSSISLLLIVACSDDDDSTGPTNIYQANASINTSDGTINLNVGFSYFNEDDNTTTIYLTDADISGKPGSIYGGNYIIINIEGSGEGTYNISSNGENQLICFLDGKNRVALEGNIIITDYGNIGSNISGSFEVNSFVNDNNFQINSSSFNAQRIDEYLLEDDDDDGGNGNDDDEVKSFNLTGTLPDGTNITLNSDDVVGGSAGYVSFSGTDILQMAIEVNPQGTNDEMIYNISLANTNNQEVTVTFEEGNYDSTFLLTFNNSVYRFFGNVEVIEAAENVGQNYTIAFNGNFTNLNSSGDDFTNVTCQFVIERQ